MGLIRDFFRSDFRTAPKFSEICSEKVQNLSHWGPIWPTYDQNLTTRPQIPPSQELPPLRCRPCQKLDKRTIDLSVAETCHIGPSMSLGKLHVIARRPAPTYSLSTTHMDLLSYWTKLTFTRGFIQKQHWIKQSLILFSLFAWLV